MAALVALGYLSAHGFWLLFVVGVLHSAVLRRARSPSAPKQIDLDYPVLLTSGPRRFAGDSPLEDGVYCELVSGARPSRGSGDRAAKPGGGGQEKTEDQPRAPALTPKNDGLSGARQVSVTAQGNQPGTPGGSRKSRTRDAYSTKGHSSRWSISTLTRLHFARRFCGLSGRKFEAVYTGQHTMSWQVVAVPMTRPRGHSKGCSSGEFVRP